MVCVYAFRCGDLSSELSLTCLPFLLVSNRAVLQVQDSLNQVSLPDLGKAGDKASDAKDNVQNAANKIGLE